MAPVSPISRRAQAGWNVRMECPDFKPLLEIVAPLEIGTVIWQLVPGSLPQLSKQRSRRPDETPFFCF